jgi:hypothetical protein
LNDSRDGSLAGDEGALSRAIRSADGAARGLGGSCILFFFGIALVAMGQELVHSSAPVIAYVSLAELLFAGYIQEGNTLVRHGLVFTAGVALGLSLTRDWSGLLIAAGIYASATILRFRFSR